MLCPAEAGIACESYGCIRLPAPVGRRATQPPEMRREWIQGNGGPSLVISTGPSLGAAPILWFPTGHSRRWPL